MTFFEEIGKDISDSGELSKLKSLASEEQKRIDALCMEIGKAYVKLHKDDYEQSFATQIDEINAANLRIKAYNDQIKVIRGVFPCPACGHDLTKEDVFCTGCGTKVVVPVPAGGACTKCGAALASDAAFCTACGTRVEAPAAKVNVCTNCGASIAPDFAFCTRCGTKVTANTPAPQKPVCTGCGATLENGAAFCTKCGTRVGTTPVTPIASVQSPAPVAEEPVEEAPVIAEAPVVAAPDVQETVAPAPVAEEPVEEAPVIAEEPVVAASDVQETVAPAPAQAEDVVNEVNFEPLAPEAVAQEPVKRFCTNCGKQVLPAAKFCIYCGNRLNA